MYYRSFTHRTAILASLTALAVAQPLLASTYESEDDDKKALNLGNIEVSTNTATDNVLPTRPTSSLYGYEQTLKETPRSIFQISKSQLDQDSIDNYSDLTRYSPSVQRTSSSPYSTFAIIRGGSSDTMRNGILLLNPAVRPFDNNSWEQADIVAGVPSVAFGSTTRTAGYVNYITKQPYFDKQHTQITTNFGRVGATSDTSYSQYSVQVDNGGPLIKDKLAYRLSVQNSDNHNYWNNSRNAFDDFYLALNWKVSDKLEIDTNATYTKSWGPYVYGINRITQNLVDNWQYTSGAASPILSYSGVYYRANTSGTYDAGSITNGQFVANGTTTSALWTQAKPASLVGWVVLPQNAQTRKVEGNHTLYNSKSFSDAHEYISQVVSTYTANESWTIRNNTLWQDSDSYVYGYDEYHSYMVNKFITSRIEAISNGDFKLFGQDITHKSNSGFDWRFLWNECDNVGKPSERPISPADVFDTGNLGTGNLLGVSSLYPNALTSSSSLYNAELTKYGYINIAPGYVYPNGRAAGLSVVSLGGSDLRINQLNTYGLYSEHNFDIGKQWSLRVGARLTRIQDYLRATGLTYAVANQGYLTNLALSDNDTAWNGDINTSLTFRPTSRITTYFTYDHDLASADCGCCLTQGFIRSTPVQGLEHRYFLTKSELYELGAKVELIPNKLFGNFAVYRQFRQIPSVPTASNPNPANVGIFYRGFESALTYQPTKHLSAGLTYSYLWATYDNQTAGSVFSSDYNGFVADGSTLINNSTSSIGTDSGVRGNYRVLALPLHTGGAWANYEFSNGFGLKFSSWITSRWQVNRFVYVPTQYNLDAGVFYQEKAWRLDISFRNVTNEKNWSPGGTYGGGTVAYLLPADRFGVTGKATYRF